MKPILMGEKSHSWKPIESEFQEKLKNAGVEIIKEAYERWDGASFYFLDPNGHTLEYIYFEIFKLLHNS